MQVFLLKAALVAASIAVLFASSATAAPFSLVASMSDVSQTLSFGRFDPSLGVLSGSRVNLLPAPSSPYAIRIGSAVGRTLSSQTGRSAWEINELLRPGGPDSATLFDRFWQSTPLCQEHTRKGSTCSETIEFSDMPIPTPGDLNAPADLPSPQVATSTAKTADAEAAMTSFACIKALSATFACTASLDSQQEDDGVVETNTNTIAQIVEPRPSPMLGGGLTMLGAVMVVLGGGTVAYRRIARKSRRRSRW